ncbi:MAG: hypothetical protein KA369_03350 [Spirochaetes bacterium]|nr:hypothetical protein [Spirochaetota bacterium]
MRVLFYTSGTTGTGRLIGGISIGNAIRRANLDWDYTIINMSPFAHLADRFGHSHVEIPAENEEVLLYKGYQESALYTTIDSLKPDIIIVDLLWFSLQGFIRDLPCKKIFLSHMVVDSFFTIHLADRDLTFRYEDYDRVFAIEPFRSKIPFDEINPIIIRNRDEILSRGEALNALALEDGKKNCLLAINANPGDFEIIKNKYSYLESEGFHMVYSSNYHGGLFPAVDYYNAFDLIVGNASYTQFWEARFFNKEAILEPIKVRFQDSADRVRYSKRFKFKENGADQLVKIITTL